jgi:iron complex outermembrane receptor protein
MKVLSAIIIPATTAALSFSVAANSDETSLSASANDIEEILVIAQPLANTPSYEEQFERFLRRPGAETVVSTKQFESSHLGTLENLLAATPGVYSVARGNQNGGLYSIRGTDIATDGPRNGRGIRAYIDGVPLGRTEAGLTVSLIDILAADYVEVYRGPNSLRFGAISAGGALNFVSRNGKNNPGSKLSVELGSFDFSQVQLQHGGENGDVDYYFSLSDGRTDGYREHTDTEASRFSSNLGWAINNQLDTRFYFTVGRDYQEQAGDIPLNLIETHGRDASYGNTRNVDFDTDRNFDYLRLSNQTGFYLEKGGKITFDSFFLRTDFDHLPTPFSGIVDNVWEEYGLGLRYDTVVSLFGLTTELTSGIRGSDTDGDFLKFRHRNGGQDKGEKVDDADFESLLLEAYGELAISLTDTVRLFIGAQFVDISRTLTDNFRVDIAPLGPYGPPVYDDNGELLERPQPGSTSRDDGYDIDYDTVNPKLGINWQFSENYFFFASTARSYEVPTGADVANVVSNGGDNNSIEPQTAWTYEFGVRGGDDKLFVDATLYYSPIKHEILSRSCDPVRGDDPSVCTDTIAFNAEDTIHKGLELGLSYRLLEDLFISADSVKVSFTWNHNIFNFDDDPTFGDNRLPVIPLNTVFTSLNYTQENGFFTELEYRYASKRNATYDGSGGDGWTIPSYETWGLLLGYKPKGIPFSFYVQGANLTDEIYVSTFTAEPTQPVSGYGPGAQPQEYVGVRVANGRSWYAGFTYSF